MQYGASCRLYVALACNVHFDGALGVLKWAHHCFGAEDSDALLSLIGAGPTGVSSATVCAPCRVLGAAQSTYRMPYFVSLTGSGAASHYQLRTTGYQYGMPRRFVSSRPLLTFGGRFAQLDWRRWSCSFGRRSATAPRSPASRTGPRRALKTECSLCEKYHGELRRNLLLRLAPEPSPDTAIREMRFVIQG
jgi:hypothetical protein